MLRILVATRDGLHTLDQSGHEAAAQHAGRPVTAVVRDLEEAYDVVVQLLETASSGWGHRNSTAPRQQSPREPRESEENRRDYEG